VLGAPQYLPRLLLGQRPVLSPYLPQLTNRLTEPRP
jgi:hypothetical protein